MGQAKRKKERVHPRAGMLAKGVAGGRRGSTRHEALFLALSRGQEPPVGWPKSLQLTLEGFCEGQEAGKLWERAREWKA